MGQCICAESEDADIAADGYVFGSWINSKKQKKIKKKLINYDKFDGTTPTDNKNEYTVGLGDQATFPTIVSSMTPKAQLRALYDYETQMESDLSFKKNDRLQLLDDSNNDWWYVRILDINNSNTYVEGYVPREYVAVEDSLASFEWFSGQISRRDAERMLMDPDNEAGTFLLRQGESCPDLFVVSVKDYQPEKGVIVKHYRIRYTDDGDCYISPRKSFDCIPELIDYYSNHMGSCVRLMTPCPRPRPLVTDLCHETSNTWEIDRNSLELYEKLGNGQFGEVWKGRWNKSINVAIKMLRPGTTNVQSFLEEAHFMKLCNHEKLVNLFAVCTREEPIFIIMELMSHGSLLNYLRDGPGRFFQLPRLIDISAQISSGMAYLETQHYIHRDLAARNVLVTENNLVKVSDFGLAKIIEEDEYVARRGSKFPVRWTAPEAALFGKYSIKSDVWSYGILLTELITHGQVPYPGMNHTEILQQVSNEGYRINQHSDCPDALYEIMLICWDHIAENRPSFQFLYQFFDDYFITSEHWCADTSTA